jgi:hypothetical protein
MILNKLKGEINMKNKPSKLSNTDRQGIYEYLLTLDCPDLLAALIAKHCVGYPRWSCKTISTVVIDNINWYKSPEKEDFWHEIYEELTELENTVVAPQEHEDALQESLEDGFESPTELDFALKGEEAKIEIKTNHEPLIIPQPDRDDSLDLSWWNKTKLFFGKVFYKV